MSIHISLYEAEKVDVKAVASGGKEGSAYIHMEDTNGNGVTYFYHDPWSMLAFSRQVRRQAHNLLRIQSGLGEIVTTPDPDEAVTLMADCVEMLRAIGDRYGYCFSLQDRGQMDATIETCNHYLKG